MEEQYWPDDDYTEYVDPGQHHPEVPDTVTPAEFGAAIHKAFEAGLAGVKPYLIFGRGIGKRLMLEEFTIHADFSEPMLIDAEPTEGFKRLKSGREMPIVKRGAGPEVNPFKRRGKG